MIQAITNSRTRCVIALLTVIVGAQLTGCAAAPIQAMSDARQAIEAAVQAGGNEKAAEQMQQARTALTQAEGALKKAQYKRARELAQQARASAIEAQRASEQ